MDFTALEMPTEREFHDWLAETTIAVQEVSGIPFEQDQLRVLEKDTPEPDAKAIDARIYFRGFAGDASLTMRVKFDVSDYETIVMPTERRLLIHGYSDSAACSVHLVTYSIEEVLAEKLRSWIQRTRARDLFDAVQIIKTHGSSIDKRRMLSAFVKKTLFKGILEAGRDELVVAEKFQTVERDWLSTIVCPSNAMILADNAIALFRQFVNALFAAPSLTSLGFGGGPAYSTYRRFASSLREAIIAAGRARQTVFMRYKGVEREIEPYCFRYRIRKSDGIGHEYFFGYDRTRGNTIKSFFVSEIEGVRSAGQHYQPRYVVEF